MEKKGLSKKKRFYLVTLALAVICLILLLWVLNHYVLDRPSFCTSCHLIQTAYDSWCKSQHKPEYTGNSCNVCHVQPGLLGSIKASLYGLKNTYTFFFGIDEDDIKASKPVYCSQKGCHEQMEKSMNGKKVRVNHGLHMSMGYSCVICHDRVAHEEYGMVKNLSMMKDFCFACHDDEVAPRTDCSICHIYQDQMMSGTETPDALASITSPHYQEEKTCQNCHPSPDASAEESCLNCHEEGVLTQYRQVRADLEKRLNRIKAHIDEAQTLFSRIQGYGPTWDELLSLFQNVQKNYAYIMTDSSKGAHNQKLTELMVKQIENDIEKVRYTLYSYQSYQ
ncbi:MAG: cytochrome c3 family protein [bacterium]